MFCLHSFPVDKLLLLVIIYHLSVGYDSPISLAVVLVLVRGMSPSGGATTNTFENLFFSIPVVDVVSYLLN